MRELDSDFAKQSAVFGYDGAAIPAVDIFIHPNAINPDVADCPQPFPLGSPAKRLSGVLDDREAVAFGDGKPFVAAMIAIDLGTVGNWAERRGIPYTSYMDLSQKAEVRALIGEEIRKGNETLPESTQVSRFLLLTKDLDADDAEVTRTRKVRRRHVAEKYAAVTDAFYGGRDEVELATTITYEDGRQATLRSRVRIEDVQGVRVHG